MKKLRVAFLLAAALSLAPALAVTPYRVADIDPRFLSDSSQPDRFVSVAGRVVFVPRQGQASLWGTQGSPGDPVLLLPESVGVGAGPVAAGGRAYFTGCNVDNCGLFATNGTPAGTIRLAGFPFLPFSTMEAVAPAGLPHALVTFNAGNGTVIWRTDGTPAGTRKVGMTARNPRGLVAFRGKAWFFADLGNAQGALFSTDGLNGGTRRIGTSTGGSRLTLLGNRLVYFAGQEIWGSDGTPAGTIPLATVPGPINDSRPPIVVAGSRAFFFNFGVEGGRRELWVTDGTPAGTRRVIAVDGDSQSKLLALGGKVGFIGRNDARGFELWASDGTAAGTRQVKDICSGSCSGVSELGVSALGRIWFSGFHPDRGSEVWTSNLTPAGTRQMRDLCPGSCSTSPERWFASGGRVYFVGQGGSDARLFASDGTAAGTLAVGPAPPLFSETFAATLSGSTIVFAGSDAVHGSEPWISNGTPAGTRLLGDLRFDNRVGSRPRSFAAAGGRAFFFAEDGVHGNELWVSDGTEEGTQLAYDLVPGPDSTNLEVVANQAGGRLVLFLRNGFNQFELVGSDGTPAGSAHLLPEGVRADGRRAQTPGKVFFVGIDDEHGAELWATDGTPEGTTRLSNLVPPDPFRPDVGLPILLAVGNHMVAPVLSPAGGEEMVISDGSTVGPLPLDQAYPFLEGPLQNAKSPLVAFNGRFWFVSAEAEDGTATLWRTDLTAAGTAPAGALDLSRSDSGRWSLVPLGGKMLVFGSATSLGDALWTSDGTAGGTRVVGPVSFGQRVAPVVFAGRLWFSDTFGDLWTTDGTVEGTQRAPDADDRTIDARSLAALGNRLVIATSGGFYESDGTAAGTVRVELRGRPDPFSAFSALAVGDRLFFTWDDFVHGPELWALRPE